MELFCGIDWASDYHDIALVDAEGSVLAKVTNSAERGPHALAVGELPGGDPVGSESWLAIEQFDAQPRSVAPHSYWSNRVHEQRRLSDPADLSSALIVRNRVRNCARHRSAGSVNHCAENLNPLDRKNPPICDQATCVRPRFVSGLDDLAT
jgi:hypothetical protein